MKIILIGLGSIGLRHLRNILQLGYNRVSIVSRSGKLPADISLPVFSSLPVALSSAQFDAAIVCTPTAFHLADVAALLKAQIPLIYIEKPVSHSLAGLPGVIALSKTYNNKIFVGYDLHFDPGLQQVRSLLHQQIIGKVVAVNAQVGQYLPDWRPTQDYRQGMSAKIETGGGVMLDLVHEFDYLLWLMGPVTNLACFYQRSGALQIETEDLSDVLLRFANGATGTIHLDYLQQKLVRNCMITGHSGSIFWNLAESSVRWIDAKKQEEVFSYAHFERNDRFLAIMQAFLTDQNDERLTQLPAAVESLKLVLAAKHSSENEIFVNAVDMDLLV